MLLFLILFHHYNKSFKYLIKYGYLFTWRSIKYCFKFNYQFFFFPPFPGNGAFSPSSVNGWFKLNCWPENILLDFFYSFNPTLLLFIVNNTSNYSCFDWSLFASSIICLNYEKSADETIISSICSSIWSFLDYKRNWNRSIEKLGNPCNCYIRNNILL